MDEGQAVRAAWATVAEVAATGEARASVETQAIPDEPAPTLTAAASRSADRPLL